MDNRPEETLRQMKESLCLLQRIGETRQALRWTEEVRRLWPQIEEGLRLWQAMLESQQALRNRMEEIATRFPDGAPPWDSLPGGAETLGVTIEHLRRQGDTGQIAAIAATILRRGC